MTSKLDSSLVFDQSGFFVNLPLNLTTASEKLYAMQYGRDTSGNVITTRHDALNQLEQSQRTKFLSDHTVVVIVTIEAYNTAKGFFIHNSFVLERSVVGEVKTSHVVLASKLNGECVNSADVFTDVVSVLLGIGASFFHAFLKNNFFLFFWSFFVFLFLLIVRWREYKTKKQIDPSYFSLFPTYVPTHPPTLLFISDHHIQSSCHQ